ncbi:hypothetical protein [Aliarcobacter butzleri]|uniref:hypothetical protein n=1 Tax=Aliarcobacter butzleri TaxID=28197 RepID=UPI0021B696B1|nr:hypothetical protein [Aliarcobacter butzleri]MCT7580161.1 hypothetical protein [Aliarcobacter butzleri]
MKILFYVEPLIEQDKPYWKDVWVGVFCRDIINTLNQSKNNYEFIIITNEAIAQKVDIDIPLIQLTQKELLDPFNTTNYMDATTAWHNETYAAEHLEDYKNLMLEKLGGFIPDIIITFSPVPFFKNMFKDTLILHHEYSIFSRLPYPQSWFLDPVGIHSNLFLNKFANEIKSSILSENQTSLVNDFKQLCQNILSSKSPFKAIFEEKRKHFDHLVLLPLQFSRYFSFDDLVPFKSQYEYCVYILDNVPSNIGVVVNTHPEYPVISKEAVEFLKTKYSNFIYEEDFNTIYASGQFIIPFVDAVITVSSSIGLQTLLFDKKLITLSDKTFSFIADDTNVNNIENVLKSDNINKDVFLYFILTRYSLTSEYLHNVEWLDSFLHKSLLHFRANEIQFDFYDIIDKEEKIFDLLSKTLDNNKKLIPQYIIQNMIQLFVENENTHFTEENSIKYPVSQTTKLQRFEFDLKDFENIKNLRLDPLNDSCVVNISKIYIVLKDDLQIDLKANIQANACSHHGDSYFFEFFDPNIYFENIDFESLTIKKFVVELIYNHIAKDSVHVCVNQMAMDKNYIIENQKQQIQNQNLELEAKEQSIKNLNDEIENQKQQIQNQNLELEAKEQSIKNLNYELINIYMSKSWKITRPLRNLIRRIKKGK